ncbi:Reverse transcriptase domain [Cinara cedri]|uniref:Reverse transcriptase domain n=1 Tax=Cinara cedri TaxID=506608 RepID=A0A5E4N906_9HEMI|nr:Reverse transcriptase domain [Cinara cedri]
MGYTPNSLNTLVPEYRSGYLDTTNILKQFKRAKVIALLKPGKSGTEAVDYRPILLLSIPYKILERFILERIQPHIDEIIPVEQAGFRNNRSCEEQVLALTTLIEAGFQKKLKTSVAFIDFSAAYDTVWRHGLLYKFSKVINCSKLMGFLEGILANRRFQVYLVTEGLKFQFADDIAIAFQCKDLKDGSAILTKDLELMKTYFRNWRLKPNPIKTEVCAFHLNNRQAHDKLEVEFDALDRSLTFNEHLSILSKKIRSRVNLVQMLAGTGWGADAKTLRVVALSLVYRTANVMRVISGTVKSTPLQWLPALANIKPPHIRWKDALVKTIKKSVDYKSSLLYQMMLQTPNQRLKSRSPPVVYARTLISLGFDSAEEWRKEWASYTASNMKLLCDLIMEF